jgi:E3 ubiquitin-protein ligase HUWE1
VWAARASSAELRAVGVFWEAVELLSQADVRRLLWWWTGSDAPPLGGFGAMEHHWSDFWNIRGLQIAVKPRRHPLPDQLQAHTCFNQLDLPAYSSLEEMRERLLVSIREGNSGFGFA